MPAIAAPTTSSFVFSWFYPAHYYGDDTCPDGLNPTPDVFFKRDLKILGIPQAKVDAMFNKDYTNQNERNATQWIQFAATRGNGRDSVYQHPTTVPDSHLKGATGRFGYGFNLDHKGAGSPHSFEDPETHVQGVNNELFRTLGCIQVYKGSVLHKPPLEPEFRWVVSRPIMGAWLISINGDLTKNGQVTVTIETSIDPVAAQDANAHVRSDMTFRVASRPTSRNVLHGRIKDGVITTDPATFLMACDVYIQPQYVFHDARLRLRVKPDGTLEGLLGGYQPWHDVYWSHAKVGYIDERGFGIDAPALYYALRRNADAYPDPKTGQNSAISTAYRFEAVPAFIVPEQLSVAPASTRSHAQTGAVAAAMPALWRRAPQTSGAPPIARRLRPDQYRRIIGDVFGPSIKIEGQFEPDVRYAGLFAVGAGHVGVTATGFEQYDAMARTIAAQVVSVEHRGTLIPCVPRSATEADDACAKLFFSKAGPLLYRRPISGDEVQQLTAIAHSAAQALNSFYAGLEMSLAGMLDTPQFLYRREIAEPDPEHSGAYRLDAYSKAEQLSFFLWNSAPDAKLIEAARLGQLGSASGLAAQVDRMLASPRLEAGVRAFFSDMLQFDLFEALTKDAQIYPKWSTKVGQDAQEQTLRTIVDQLLTQRGDYRDLFTTRATFLTPLLGSVYRVPVVQNAGVWQHHEFSKADPRVGIQSHASFVALHSHEGLSSPTLRGKALRELLLCEPIPAPPADVNFAVAQDTHNPIHKTMRDRLTAHRTDPTCAGCHKLMDPIGLALESFDSDASYRSTENGQPLDTSGELDGIGFSDAAGLGRAVHDNPATSACLVRRVYAYATGRSPARRDMEWIRSLEQDFGKAKYRMPDLLRRIATSEDLYRVAGPHAGGSAATVAALATPNQETTP